METSTISTSSVHSVHDHDYTNIKMEQVACAEHEFSTATVNEANLIGQGKWRIDRAGDYGWGIFAERDFMPGELVFKADVDSFKERDSHTIQVAMQKHCVMKLPGILINHSCEANTGIKDNDQGIFDFFAVTQIRTGE